MVKIANKYNTIAFYEEILYNLNDLRKMSKKGDNILVIMKIRTVKNNRVLYSNNDKSDIIPANTAYLSLRKIL